METKAANVRREARWWTPRCAPSRRRHVCITDGAHSRQRGVVSGLAVSARVLSCLAIHRGATTISRISGRVWCSPGAREPRCTCTYGRRWGWCDVGEGGEHILPCRQVGMRDTKSGGHISDSTGHITKCVSCVGELVVAIESAQGGVAEGSKNGLLV